MSAEIKSKGPKLESHVSESLKKKFKSRCKKANISMAQRIRDLVQKDLKG